MSDRIVEKRGWFWNMLAFVVRVLTLGRNRTFLTDYLTTIGNVIGVPVGWDPARPEHAPVLEHERTHIAQQRRLGFGVVWIGLIPWGLAYLLLPLPVGLAWCRYRLELEAYIAGHRAELARLRAAGAGEGEILSRRAYLISLTVDELTTGAYGWAWPFPGAVRRELEEKVI